MPTLQTPRLILRRWCIEDLAPFIEISADPQVMEHYPNCWSMDDCQKFITRTEERFEKSGFGFWAIELKETGGFIGFTGLSSPTFETSFTPCVEIGWRLAKNQWGKGYATEAAKACLNFGFNELDLKEILSWTYTGNIRSRNVMERIGMTYEDNFDHPALPDGHTLKPHALYRIRK